MEMIKKAVHAPSTFFEEQIKDFIDEPLCFLDIETTGFNRQFDQVILIGILYATDDHYELLQFFIGRDSNDEALLKAFSDKIRQFSSVITYNGLSFDVPFLRERMKRYRLPFAFNHLGHIDLYRHLLSYKHLLSLNSYRLSSVESYLGISRKDVIDGRLSIQKFNEYRRSSDKQCKEDVLLHNYEDLLHLPAVTRIFSHIPVPEFFFQAYHHHLDIEESAFHYSVESKGLTLVKHEMILNGTAWSYDHYHDIKVYDDLYQFTFNSETEVFQLKLFLHHMTVDADHDVLYLKADHLSRDLRIDYGSLVDNNIIMVINEAIHFQKALPAMERLLESFFLTYLRKRRIK